MKRFSFFMLTAVTFLSLSTLISCASDKVTKDNSHSFSEEDEIIEVIDDKSESDEIQFLEDDDNEENEEYLRSTNNLSAEESVTKEEFEEDKAEILRIISELEIIMKKGDFASWKTYIAPDSINYYSNPANIRKVQKKLPDKTIQLHGLNDYFKHVFIKARQGSTVEEIRYISKNNIRGGYYKNDGTFVITYYFVKIDGKWYVHIPAVS